MAVAGPERSGEDSMRKIIRRIQQMRTKASRDFNKSPSQVMFDQGYVKGYDAAIKAVIETLKEIDKEKE